jgi:hypothetical protein
MNNHSPDETLFPTPEELKLGFALTTIKYPAKLPFSQNAEGDQHSVYDKTVALELNEEYRIRRRKFEAGYILERWDGCEWNVAAVYPTLMEVSEDALVKEYLAKQKKVDEPIEEENDE